MNFYKKIIETETLDINISRSTISFVNMEFTDENNLQKQNTKIKNPEVVVDDDVMDNKEINSWDDLEGLADIEKARMASKILMEDEAKFIKFSESPLLFSDIYEIIN